MLLLHPPNPENPRKKKKNIKGENLKTNFYKSFIIFCH